MKVYDRSQPWPTPLEDATDGQVLVPLLDEPTETALSVGADLSRRASGEVVVLDPVVNADGAPPDADSPEARYDADAEVGKYVQSLADEPGVTANGVVRTGESAESVVTSAVAGHPVEALVVPVAEETRDDAGKLAQDAAERLGQHAACRTVAVTGPLPENVSSVLLPVAGGPHSGAAVRVAHAVADASDASVEAVHVVPPVVVGVRRESAREYVATAEERLVGVETAAEVIEADDPTAALVGLTDDYDATALGAPSKGRLRRFLFGSVPESVAVEGNGAVFTVRSAETGDSSLGKCL